MTSAGANQRSRLVCARPRASVTIGGGGAASKKWKGQTTRPLIGRRRGEGSRWRRREPISDRAWCARDHGTRGLFLRVSTFHSQHTETNERNRPVTTRNESDKQTNSSPIKQILCWHHFARPIDCGVGPEIGSLLSPLKTRYNNRETQ